LNAEKLPKLIEGNDLAVDIPPNIRPVKKEDVKFLSEAGSQ